MTVDHLVGLGHQRIAHIDGSRAPGATERRRGYCNAMRAHGITEHEQVVRGGLTENDGATAAQALLNGRHPTAITVFNDRCATGVLDTLRNAGLAVPSDISIVGNDNSRLGLVRRSTTAKGRPRP